MAVLSILQRCESPGRDEVRLPEIPLVQARTISAKHSAPLRITACTSGSGMLMRLTDHEWDVVLHALRTAAELHEHTALRLSITGPRNWQASSVDARK
jgi:hypothetical protein